MDWKIRPCGKLRGEISPPPDKSISHRAVMFGAISKGDAVVYNFLRGEDCMRTLEAFSSLGIKITQEEDKVIVRGRGLRGLTPPKEPVYLGNSGTSMRIISGILAGQNFTTILTGDESLSKRPMKRIIDPLALMGANVEPAEGGDHAPLKIHGSFDPLKPVDYVSPVASAQVKSCVLAAGLYADGVTSFTEPYQSRDHTERMLELFQAGITREGLTTRITGLKELVPMDIIIPGDISSAAFFIVAALLVENSKVLLKNVGLNSTRRGLLNVLMRMGADIEIIAERGEVEPSGDLVVRSSSLKGTLIGPEEIPLLIDEVPIILLAASMAEGETLIKGASELKVKETDRVKSMKNNLGKMGARIKEDGDALIVTGGIKKFKAAGSDSYADHRTAMSMAIAALVSDGECVIKNTECVATSYPGFLEDLSQLRDGR